VRQTSIGLTVILFSVYGQSGGHGGGQHSLKADSGVAFLMTWSPARPEVTTEASRMSATSSFAAFMF